MFKKAALDILTSFFDVATIPLLDNEDASSNDMIYVSPSTTSTNNTSLVKSSSSQSPGGIEQLHFFHEMYQFWPFWWSLLEQEPPLTNKDYSRTENLMWTFAFGNTMLWCHSA